MRRFISFMTASILMGTTVFAAPEVVTKDAAENIITISGSANDGDIVSLIIANSGYDINDILTLPKSALQYFDSTEATDGMYSFDIKINNELGTNGLYSAIVNVAGEEEKFTFRYYSNDEKLTIIERVNASGNASDLLEKYSSVLDESVIEYAIKAYNLDSLHYLNDAGVNNIAKIIFAGKGSGYQKDADEMYGILNSSIYLAALNSSSDKTFTDNILAYPEILGIETSGDIYKDYVSELNSDGIKAVEKAMSGSAFVSVSDAKIAFEEAVILNLITNNIQYGNGHVKEILEKYESNLEKAGFKLTRLKTIKNKSDLYDELSSAKVTSLSKLATVFNEYDEDENSGKGGSGSSGSGGLNHGSMTSNTGSLPTYIPSQADTPSTYTFADIQTVSWAKEAIEALAELGIVNGKGNDIFDPDGSVTRAEFTKMIVGATGLWDNAAECSFSDVNSHWAYKYIASAFKHGIVSGTGDNIYSPDSVITREQGATIIYRALISMGNKLSADANSFSDNDMLSDWAQEAVNALSAEGIINGKGDNMFAPKDTLTRAEAAKIIYSTMKLFINGQEG